MMLPGLGITWEWTRWLLRNLGHGISSRSISGLVHIFSTHPRLTPWPVFFAASRPSDQEDSRAIFAERIEFRPDCCRDEMSVLRFETGVEAPTVFGTHLGRWEPGGSSTDLAPITTLLGSFKIWRFRVCATTFVLGDNNWSRASLGLSGPESRTHT